MYIMLIDDDEGCLDSMKSSLELYGHVCEAYSSPEKAVKSYNPSRHEIVITDMKMPGMTGMDVLKKIKAANPESKVIIITAYGDVDTAISAVNNHAYAFFGKPINFRELVDTLEKIEKEHEEKKLTKEEHVKLNVEYSKLKQAFEELQALLKKKMPGKQ